LIVRGLGFKIWVRAVRFALGFWTLVRMPMLLLSPVKTFEKKWLAESQQINPGTHLDNLQGRSAVRLLIVIPYRDHFEITKNCLMSLQKQDLASLEIELVLVDNDSTPETEALVQAWVEGLARDTNLANVRIHRQTRRYAFNFSKLNNEAVGEIDPNGDRFDYYLFLNNDIEFIAGNSLQQLTGFALSCGQRLGSLGCSLLYENQTVQHSFVLPGFILVGVHPFKGLSLRRAQRSQWFNRANRVPAVTGACLLTPAAAFWAAGRFDESLATNYQDVDLCLKYAHSGRENWVLSSLFAYHKESRTRQAKPSFQESQQMYRKWRLYLESYQPMAFKLSKWSERPLLAAFEGNFPWRRLY
jgi:GT2 family glycosyltransferase